MRLVLFMATLALTATVHADPAPYFETPPPVMPLAPPLSWSDHLSTPDTPPLDLAVADAPFEEQVRVEVSQVASESPLQELEGLSRVTTELIKQGGRTWVGTNAGLYFREAPDETFDLYPHYGDGQGPLSSRITGLALDTEDTLWVASAGGLSAHTAEGLWQSWRGRDGLPIEELTSVAVDSRDRIWLGSEKGLILFDPPAPDRHWHYLQGQRYLPEDHVLGVQVSDDGVVRVKTSAGWTGIETVERTLREKAAYFLDRYEERHRRLGMPSPATYEAPEKMDTWIHTPQASDGLWTSYNVTSMALAYALTGDERYKKLARENMEALYRLQNVTGIEGLVARSVVAIDEPTVPQLRTQDNWHETADGKYLWRDDVSSDQITGHFLAFYTYFEHIAKSDPAERARLEKQLRQVLDYILDNNYQIIDLDGKRTLWGWWNPEMVNDAEHYLESGLYSLMMLSFLKTAHYITGDEKYLDEFKMFIADHGYLSNILTQKWMPPDEVNHSDDQLSAVVFYPFLQMETDPYVRDVLHRALRKHAKIEVPERNSLMAMVYATVDPEDADIEGALQTLREMPLDERNWQHDNSERDDVLIDDVTNVRGRALLTEVIPADERHFARWNADPYEAVSGGDGTQEGACIQWLLPYWIARYHGILAE